MNVDVTTRGEVPSEAIPYAREKLERLQGHARAEVDHANVVLRQEANPRIELPSRAEGELNLSGPVVRAQVAEATMPAAIDALARHLDQQLRRFVERRLTAQRRPISTPDGEWRHGDWSPPRPAHLRRAPEEREVVRRKTFAMSPMSPAEAAADLEDLDHSFYLFQDAESEADAVLYHRDDDRIGVIGPAGTDWAHAEADGIVGEQSRTTDSTSLDDAIAEMNELSHRFMYFVNAETDRGNVIYVRYDGNYGLIEAR